MRVILMGLRGSGKTTAGHELARRWGLPFVDLDEVTPGLLGCATAGEALRSKGETAFREAEARALRETLAAAPSACVLSLGGGTPTAPGAAEMLRGEVASGRARVSYLHASPAALRDRLSAETVIERPSLTGGPVLDEIGEVYANRDGLYRSIASAVIEVEGKSISQVCDEVMSQAGA